MLKKIRGLKIELLLLLGSALLSGCWPLQNQSSIQITAAGDIRISQRFIKNRSQELKNIRLRGDLVFANFEGVLSEKTYPDPFILTMPGRTISFLKPMGFNWLNLANNHSLDLGRNGYQTTCQTLKRAGFFLTGLNDQRDQINLQGRTIQIIGFSFGTSNDVNDPVKAAQIIRNCSADIIIVSAHMGGENSRGYLIPSGMEYFGSEKRGDVIRFSHACIDAGADLVLGHSPHILRKIALYRNKLIVYSLGNFIFDYPGVDNHPATPGFSISVYINGEGVFQKARIDSYTLRYGIPLPDPQEKAFRWIRSLSRTGKPQLLFRKNGWIFKNKGDAFQ